MKIELVIKFDEVVRVKLTNYGLMIYESYIIKKGNILLKNEDNYYFFSISQLIDIFNNQAGCFYSNEFILGIDL